jgi:endonuclease/exonuclease/phosphatase family metal-dependent hydrolase
MYKIFNSAIFVLLFLLASQGHALDTYLEQGNVTPNDNVLYHPIARSTGKQLTIVSWNVRNLGAYSRSIKDYISMANLVEGADLIVFQEVGLGLLRTDSLTSVQEYTLTSVKDLWQIHLGDDWVVALADHGSGKGAGRETSMVAHRKSVNGKSIKATFNGYYELGKSRDMPLWDIEIAGGESVLIGSVHLTPDDPARGQEMLNMLNWLKSKKDQYAVVLGDMNYGYQKKSGAVNYIGEKEISALDASGTIYQVFRELSYLGKGSATALRTNLGYRSGAYFYDQFLLTPKLSNKMSYGGVLLKDAGMLAFGVHDKYMKDRIKKESKKRSYALNKYAAYEEDDGSLNQANFDKAIDTSQKQAGNDATWSLSDHRPIWIKLDLL